MIGGSRQVLPLQQKTTGTNIYFESGWSDSDDSEQISALAYRFRKVIKTDISKICDKSEIEFIEKRFEDTSRVIFKELEQYNHSLLQKSYKHPLRSDIVAIEGARVISPNSSTLMGASNKNVRNGNRKDRQPTIKITGVPTIENVWREQEPLIQVPGQLSSAEKPTKQPRNRIGKNTISPEVDKGRANSRRRDGICRVT